MKTSILITTCVSACTNLLAQPILTADNSAPQTGDSSTYYYLDTPPASMPGASGAGVTWDFSSDTGVFPNTTHYIDPSTAPNGSDFPIANVAAQITANQYEFYQICADSFVSWGTFFPPSLHDKVYDNPELILPYPLHYLDTELDTFHADYTNPSGVFVHRKGYITITADGYGQLKLPGITLNNVLRIKHSYHIIDIPPSGPPANYVDNRYFWYCPGIRDYLLYYYETAADNYAYYRLATEASGSSSIYEPTAKQIDISLYPNPVQDLLSVSCALSISRLEIFDSTGKMVETLYMHATNKALINTKLLGAGLYYINVYTGGTKISKAFVK